MAENCSLKINIFVTQNFYSTLSSKDLSKVQLTLLNLLDKNSIDDIIRMVKNIPPIRKRIDTIGEEVFNFINDISRVREFLSSPKIVSSPKPISTPSKEIEIDNPDQIVLNGKRNKVWLTEAWGIASLALRKFIANTFREINTRILRSVTLIKKDEDPAIVLNSAIQNYFTSNLIYLRDYFERVGKSDYIKLIEDNMPFSKGVNNPNARINNIVRGISDYFQSYSNQEKTAYSDINNKYYERAEAFARFLLILPLNFDNFIKSNFNSIQIKNMGRLTNDINKYYFLLGKGRQNATWQDEDTVYKITRMVDSVVQSEISSWPIYRRSGTIWLQQIDEFCDTNKVVGTISKLLNIADLKGDSKLELFKPIIESSENDELLQEMFDIFGNAFGYNIETNKKVIEEVFEKYIEGKNIPQIIKNIHQDSLHLLPIIFYLLTKQKGVKQDSIVESELKNKNDVVKLDDNEINIIHSVWHNMFDPMNNDSLFNRTNSENVFDVYQMLCQVLLTHERKNLYGFVNDMGTVNKKYYSIGKANQRLNYFLSKVNGFYSPLINHTIYNTEIINDFNNEENPSTTIIFTPPYDSKTRYTIIIGKNSTVTLTKNGKLVSSEADVKLALEQLKPFFESTIKLDFTSKDKSSLTEIYRNLLGNNKMMLENLVRISANFIYANEISKFLLNESVSDFKNNLKRFYREIPNLVKGVTYNQIDAFSGKLFAILSKLSLANDIHDGIMGDIIVKGGSGELINSVILSTLTTKFSQFVEEKSQDPNSSIKHFSIQDAYKRMTFLRDYVDKTGEVKSSTSMNVEEFFINSFIYDFYGDSLAVHLGVLSDKPNIPKMELYLNTPILIEGDNVKKLKDCTASDLRKVAVRELGQYYLNMKFEIDRNLRILSKYSPNHIVYSINDDYSGTRGYTKQQLEQDIHEAIYLAQQAKENIEINDLLYFSWDKNGNLHTKPSLIAELAKHDVPVNTFELNVENSEEFFERKELELVTNLLQDLRRGISFLDSLSLKIIDSPAVKAMLKANRLMINGSAVYGDKNSWTTRSNVIIGKILYGDLFKDLITKRSLTDWSIYKNLWKYLNEVGDSRFDLSKLDINGDFDMLYFLGTINTIYPQISEYSFVLSKLSELRTKLLQKLSNSNSKINKKALTERYKEWRKEYLQQESEAEFNLAVLNYETETDERVWRDRDTANKMEVLKEVTSLDEIELINKKYKLGIDTNFTLDSIPTFRLKVNPELQRYNTLHYLYSEEGMNSLVGSHINHKAKYNTNLSLLGAIETGQQAKRNVSLSGAKNQYTRGDIRGMNPTMRIAVVNDVKAGIFTVNGIEDSKAATPMDGSTIGNYVTRKEELYSLGSQKAGIENSKPLGNDLNPRTGTGTIIKTAEFVLTNGRIRTSERNIIMHKHMNNILWDSSFDGNFLHDYNNNDIKYNPVIVFKPSVGKYYLRTNFLIESDGKTSFLEVEINDDVLSVKVGNLTIGSLIKSGQNISLYFETIKAITGQKEIDVITTTRPIRTNYELWDLFGGAYSSAITESNTLTYENDNTSLENLTIAAHSCGKKINDGVKRPTNSDVWLPLKEAKIDWIVTEGAIKQGASNINSTLMFDDENYHVTTQIISTADIGMLLNPEHLVDKSHVTLMTLVVNALGLRGFSVDAARRCYLALATLTDSSLKELFDGIEADIKGEDDQKFKDAVSSLLLKSIIGASETDGDLLASIVVLLNKQEKNGHDYDVIRHKLPISDPAVLNKLISNFSSLMTKAGIRISFPGSMNVLVPSDGIYKIYGGTLRQFASTSRTGLIKNNEVEAETKKLLELQAQLPIRLLHEITLGASYFLDIDNDSIFYDIDNPNITVIEELKPWKDDPSRVNQTRRFYISGQEELGYFELVADTDFNTGELNKEYSVHFKPTDSLNPNAFTQEQKEILFKAIADSIPYGAVISTWEELSPGGVHGINRFSKLGFVFIGESRKGKMKETGEDINIPIFRKTLKINDLTTYYRVRDLLKNKGYSLVEDVFSGRDLAPYNCTFSTDKGNFMLWDLDSIKHIYMAENSSSEVLNLLKTLSPEQIFETFHIDQQSLDYTDNKNLLKSFKKLINIRKQIELNSIGSGNDNDIYIDGLKVFVDKSTLQVFPYELIAPKNYETTFGLLIGDDLSKIASDLYFFLKRMIDNYSKSINSDYYDIILKTVSGGHYPILYNSGSTKIPKGLEKITDLEFYSRLDWDGSKVYRLDEDGNRLYEIPCSKDSNNRIVYDAEILVDSNGNEVIFTSNIKAFVNKLSFNNIDFGRHILESAYILDIINELQDSKKPSVLKFYTDYTSKLQSTENVTDKKALANIKSLNESVIKSQITEWFEQRDIALATLRAEIENGSITSVYSGILGQMIRSAIETHTSFLKSLEYIVSRTPAQSHQSFMPMKLVAFDESGKNSAYVSRWQLYLQGSDFDVDKASLLGSIIKNGKYVKWSPFMSLQSIELLKASEKLPFPTGKELVFVDSLQGLRIYDVIDKPINIIWEDNNIILTLPDFEQNIQLIKNENGIWETNLTLEQVSKLSPMSVYILERAISDKIPEGELFNMPYDMTHVGFNEQGIRTNANYNYGKDFELFVRIFTPIFSITGKFLPSVENIKQLSILINAFNSFGKIPKIYTHDVIDIIKKTVDKHNLYFSDNVSADPKDADVNYISSLIFLISSDPVNLVQGMTSVDQQTDVIKSDADTTQLAKLSQHFDKGNIMSTFRLLRLTLSGKLNTGIEASALKVMEAINLYLDVVLDYGSNEELLSLITPLNIGGFVIEMICNAYAKNIANIKSKEVYDALLEIDNSEDQALWLSAFLSLSTDNAKDPTLAKINANPEMIGLYNAGFVLGLPIDFLVKVIMSPTGMALSEIQQGNIFLGINGSRNLKNVIRYVEKGPQLNLNPTSLNILTKAIQALFGEGLEIKSFSLIRSLMPKWYRKEDLFLARRIIRLAKSLAYGTEGEEIEYNIPSLKERVKRELKIKSRQLRKVQRAIDSQKSLIKEAEQLGKKSHKRLDNGLYELTKLLETLETEVKQLEDIKLELNVSLNIPNKGDEGSKYQEYRDYKQKLESLLKGKESGILHSIEGFKDEIKESLNFKKAIADIEAYLNICEQIQMDEGFNGEDGNHYYPLQIIKELNQMAGEMSLLRPLLGLNQQLPNSKENQLSFIQKFLNIINDRLAETEIKETDALKILQSLNELLEKPKNSVSIIDFVWNEDYRKAAIAAYDSIKYKVNILDAITKVEHYFGYLKTCSALYKSLQNVSLLYREQDRIAEQILRGDLKIKSNTEIEKRLKQASRYISRRMNNMFLYQLNVELTIPNIVNGVVDDSSRVTIKLGTIEGNTAFKQWMDLVIIPKYKQAYFSNRFFKELSEVTYHKSDTHNTIVNFTTGIDVMSTNPSEIMKVGEVMEAFNRLQTVSIDKTLPLIDAFFYYDLIAYDRLPGLQALTPLFNTLLALGNTKVISDYVQFVSDLDLGGNYILTLDPQTIDEIERFIAPIVSIYSLNDSDEKYCWVKDPEDLKFYLLRKNEPLQLGTYDEEMDIYEDPSQDIDNDFINLGDDINSEMLDESYKPLTLSDLVGENERYSKVSSSGNVLNLYMDDFTTTEDLTILDGQAIINSTQLTIGNSSAYIKGNELIISDEIKSKLRTITGLDNVDDLIVTKILVDGNTPRTIIDVDTTKGNLENPCK